MTEDTVCPVCGLADATPVMTRQGFTYARCQGCRTVYINPMPSAEVAAAYYQNPAYFAGDEGGYRDYAAMHKALTPHFRRRLRVLAQWLPRRGRLLDVGCADGYFLELARAEGWDVAGVEVQALQSDARISGGKAPVYADGLSVSLIPHAFTSRSRVA